MLKSMNFLSGNSRGEEYGLLRSARNDEVNTLQRTKEQSRGEGNGLLRSARNDVSSVGRSMIEMLGVLAIVGVLTVGGIAGYSKAMEQYKLNKVLNQYSHLLQGLIEYGGKMRNSGNDDVQLGDAVNAIGLIPSTWHYRNDSGLQNFQDDIGNIVHIVSREGNLVFNLSLRANDAQFSSKTCVNFFQYIFQPLHSTFKRIVMFDRSGVNQNQWYYGDSLCSNYHCLNNMTLSAMHNACGYCAEREGSGCFLVIQL
ncbi:MAG: hypothetical protein ACI4OE_07375 [Alphaproteobacteria bacterium]